MAFPGLTYAFDAMHDTPSMVADRRRRAAEIAARIGMGQPSIGSGVGDIFRGIGAGLANYRADQAETAGNQYGQSAVDQLSSLLAQPANPGLPQPPNNSTVTGAIKTAITSGQTPQLAVYTPPQTAQDIPTVQPPRPMPQPIPAASVGNANDNQDATDAQAQDQTQAQPQPPAQPVSMAPASTDAAVVPKIMQILNNPWVSDADKAVLRSRLDQIQKQSDPAYQLDLKYKQAQLDNLDRSQTLYTDPHSGNLYTYDASNPTGTMKLVRKADPVTADSIKGPAKVQEYNFYANQEKAAGREPMSFEQFTARASGLNGVAKDDIEAVGDAIISGNQPPDTKGLYKGGLPVKAYLQKKGFNLSQANQEWVAANKFISSSQGPQQLRVRQNIDALAQSLPHLQELVDKYKAGRFPMLNSAMMAADYNGFTSPEQQSLVNLIKQQISDVQAQTAGVIMGSGSPTDAAFQLAHDQLQANWSQKSIDDALQNMKLNLQYRVNALKNAVPDDNRYVKPPAIAPDAPPPAASDGEQWTIGPDGNPMKVK